MTDVARAAGIGVATVYRYYSTKPLLMPAAATRYAVGLVYGGGQDPEKELVLLKNMLLREHSTPSIS